MQSTFYSPSMPRLILITTVSLYCRERWLTSHPSLKPALVTEELGTLLMCKAWHFVCPEQHCIQCVNRHVRDEKPHLGFQPWFHFWELTSQDLSLLLTEWWGRGKNRKSQYTESISRSSWKRPHTTLQHLLLTPRTNRKGQGRERKRGTYYLPPVSATGKHPSDLGFSQLISHPPSQGFSGRKIEKG